MTNNFLKGSALGALAAALGLTALPASAAPAVDFDAPMTAIDVGTANDDAKLAQDRDQYQRSRGEPGERRQVFRQQRSSAPDAAVAPPRAQRAQETRRAERPRRAERTERAQRSDRRDANSGNVFRRANEALREQAQADRDRREARRERREDWREDRRERREDARERRQDRREDWRERRADRRETWRDNRRDAYRDQRNYRDQRDQRNWRQDRYRDQRQAYRGGHYGRYYDGRRWNDYRVWNRSDWRRNQRYDWHRYRAANRSLFNIGRYYSPYRNHRYNRLSIGITLGSGFYSNRYTINDPWRYRLPEVYGPYRWVRYYDDVLLVDIYSGEVVDAIYDFFW